MFVRDLIVRLGLRWQLLIAFVLAVVLSVGGVQVWTLRVSLNAVEHQMQRNLDASLALLKAYLSPLGTEWSQVGGTLQLGTEPLVGRQDLVDRAAAAAGGVMTIFAGDERLVTTVRNPNGSRAVGTKLTDPVVRDAVLKQGRAYKGTATILGRRHLTIYEPIHDTAGVVIAILFTGLPMAELEAAQDEIVRQAVLAAIAIVSAFAIIGGWLLIRALRPLNDLAATTRLIAGGDLDQVVQGVRRRDEIGRLAQAVQVFKDAAGDKRRLEAQAIERNRLAESDRLAAQQGRDREMAAQARVVTALATGLERLAGGDLTIQLDRSFSAEYEAVRTHFNAAVRQLQEMVRGIAANTEALRSSTDDISRGTDDLSQRTEQQASNLAQTAAALNQMTATVGRTAEGAKGAHAIVSRARDDAKRSSEVVRQAVAAMGTIEASSQQIGQIIGVIDEIAFQTNLLALNAGVEAARAGDTGRGFAVVASEVRALAQRSADAAKEIKALVTASAQQVQEGVRLVGDTGEMLTGIVAQVADVGAAVESFAASAVEQARGLAEVNQAVGRMDRATQENAAMVGKSTAASHALAQETEHLAGLTSRFRLGDAVRAA